MQITQSHIDTYKSLFRGRDDVYAVRWEKEGRSGYMPAYKVDWDDYIDISHREELLPIIVKKNICLLIMHHSKSISTEKLQSEFIHYYRITLRFLLLPILMRLTGRNPSSNYTKYVKKLNCLRS